MQTSIKITLDTRRLKKTSNAFPVKLRVSCNRKTRDYPTIYNLSRQEFAKFGASNLNQGSQKTRDDLKKLKEEATVAASKIAPFDFVQFYRVFVKGHQLLLKKSKAEAIELPPSISQHFDLTEYYKRFPILNDAHPDNYISGVFCSYIRQLLTEKRIGTALKYRDSYIALKKFSGNVRFSEITIGYLRSFEAYLLNKNRTKTTVGMILRNLRAIFNEADALQIISKSNCYPFGRRKYQIPTSRKVKKALSLEDIGRIYYYKAECEDEEKAKALWLFCYFGNGMNPKDMIYLKYKNINGEFLSFERAKTMLTSRSNPMPVTVYINEDMQEIINRWGNPSSDNQNYIFPFLKPGLTALEEYGVVVKVTRFMNDWTKKIGENLNINCKLTSIVSRHSFSTRLKRSGVSTEFIQESLGHADKRTTENYLDGFENDVKKEFAAKLSEFKIK